MNPYVDATVRRRAKQNTFAQRPRTESNSSRLAGDLEHRWSAISPVETAEDADLRSRREDRYTNEAHA